MRLASTAAEIYCNDIIVASNGINEHLQQLERVFERLLQHNLSTGPTKAFVGFPVAVVSGKLVDVLGMSTAMEKLAAVRGLMFPRNLEGLEQLLGFSGSIHKAGKRGGEE